MELSLPSPPRRLPRGGAASRLRPSSRPLAWLSGNRLALRVVLGALIATPLLGGGWLWLRNSSLVSVRHVHITGVHGVDAIQIRTALDNAAGRMTTMNLNVGTLHSAVAPFAIVAALHVSTSFPHTVSISVTERPPVAALESAGQRTAVAADGMVLGPALLSSSLPVLKGAVEPAAGAHLSESGALAAVAVLGAAPTALARFITRVFNGPEGLTVAMRNGLLIYFGNATRPHAKWLSLARVLTSPSSAGAWYVDVRLPERPAAGLSSVAASTAPTSVQTGASDPTAAALAASLATAVSGSSTASTSPTETSEATASETSSTSANSAPSSQSSAPTETPVTSTTEASSPPTAGG